MKKALGYLRRGDLFLLDGIEYRVSTKGAIANGYVPCVEVDNGETKRFHIDTEVESLKN